MPGCSFWRHCNDLRTPNSCWCLGDDRSQDISRLNIDLALWNIPVCKRLITITNLSRYIQNDFLLIRVLQQVTQSIKYSSTLEYYVFRVCQFPIWCIYEYIYIYIYIPENKVNIGLGNVFAPNMRQGITRTSVDLFSLPLIYNSHVLEGYRIVSCCKRHLQLTWFI